jgi:hypothetical protein
MGRKRHRKAGREVAVGNSTTNLIPFHTQLLLAFLLIAVVLAIELYVDPPSIKFGPLVD